MATRPLPTLSTELYLEAVSAVVGDTIRNVKLHPVQLKLIFAAKPKIKGALGAIEDFFEENEYEDAPPMTVFEEEFAKWDWDTVLFPNTTLLTMSSDTLLTSSDETGNMGFTEEDFVWTTATPGGATLRDLTEAVYRLKGSKYDWWYELYGGLSQVGNSSHLELKVDFNYDA